MKTLNIIAVVALSIVMFTACEQEEFANSDVQTKTKTKTLNSKSLIIGAEYTPAEFFEEFSSMTLPPGSEDAIYIDYEWNPSTELITFLGSEVREPDFFVLQAASGDKYTVDCDNGDDSWSETCDGKWSCGSLISDCLDEGGCAEICTNQIAYIPQTNGIYLYEMNYTD